VEGGGDGRAGRGGGAGLGVDGVDDQAAGLAVQGGVDPADEAVAVQDGQDVVAVAAGRLGDVDLQAEAEAEQPLGPLAVDDQVVEGRQQGRPWPPVAGLEALQEGQVVGVDVPGAFRSAPPAARRTRSIRPDRSREASTDGRPG